MESTCQIFVTHDDVASREFFVRLFCVFCDLRRKLFRFFILALLFIFSAKP